MSVSSFLFFYVYSFFYLYYFSDSTDKWYHTVFVFDLFHQAYYSLDSSTLMQMAEFHSFLWRSSIPLCVGEWVGVWVVVVMERTLFSYDFLPELSIH